MPIPLCRTSDHLPPPYAGYSDHPQYHHFNESFCTEKSLVKLIFFCISLVEGPWESWNQSSWRTKRPTAQSWHVRSHQTSKVSISIIQFSNLLKLHPNSLILCLEYFAIGQLLNSTHVNFWFFGESKIIQLLFSKYIDDYDVIVFELYSIIPLNWHCSDPGRKMSNSRVVIVKGC